ncbi:GumC family protein [Vibrio scophthalmi]|uniref:non-specific protein-tyrosine kinase n=1 Tax=Vibrio scophthalmi TaxID=45658 RepID=A0A1C7FFY0_9VIBR|nr:polysaccharide biosynthesis tyrosine autokinase [Vibrio scophthalmi]ANU38627.1 Succinoglycan biosynthesis transport protein ExoP [Vibrio scophthalmi]
MKLLSDEKTSIEGESVDFGKYIVLLKRSWLKITLFTTLVTVLAALFALSIAPTYQATATLLIESNTSKAVSIEEVVGIDSTQQEYYLTQFEILKSRRIAERVIAQLNLEKNKEFNPYIEPKQSFKSFVKEKVLALPMFKSEEAKVELTAEEQATKIRYAVLAHFQSKLLISPIRKTQLVRITFESLDPQLAADIANAVGEAYILEGLDARLDATEHASSWISGRMAQLQEQLKRSENTLIEFLANEKLVDDSGIDVQASTVINDLILRLSEVTDRRIQLESAYSTLSSGGSLAITDVSSVPEISKHPQVTNLRGLLANAKREQTEFSKTYGPKHEKMIAVSAKRANLEEQLNQLIRQLVGGIGKELQAVRSQERLISRELDNRKQEFQNLTVKKRQYEALLREEETNRNILNIFLNRQKETTATGDFDSRNARFTDEALAPQSPAKPNKKLIVGLAMIAALLLSISVVLLLDAFNNTITSIKHCEDKLGIIPLGGIPKLNKFKKRVMGSDVFFSEKFMTFNESIRSARTALALANKNNKFITISSSLPNEGKTTCSINLALAFSKVENTLLIDCDLRKSAVAERFGHKRYKPGLTNHLLMNTDLDECFFVDERSGLTVLAAGMPTQNPQELLSSERFAQLLHQLSERFDKVIIDTPPALVVSDSMIISKITGKVVVVLRASSTRVATLRNTISRFMSHDVQFEGLLLNQISEGKGKQDYVYGDYIHHLDKVPQAQQS